MISRITGKIIEKGDNYLMLDLNGIAYQVLVPPAVMQRIGDCSGVGESISLRTFHYLQTDQSKSVPVLIGFINEIEQDFFEVFITVSGIGPRAALRAINKPISEIARAIDEGDLAFLKALPGIGEQRAKEIVAKLQNKIGRFGLIQDQTPKTGSTLTKDIAEEALAVLMQLEYKKTEALSMIKKSLELFPDTNTTEELLNLVYKQRKIK
ncbi:MAG: Holliday junction branch migration protein RuvA [Candidatus Omnitrophota bacterium]|jgi:Holliday junction DNA helicase RuvA